MKDREMIEELNRKIQQAKKLEKRIKELKTHFTHKVGKRPSLKIGKFLVILSKQIRTTIDRQKLESDIGIEKIKKYEKTTEFKKFELKDAA